MIYDDCEQERSRKVTAAKSLSKLYRLKTFFLFFFFFVIIKSNWAFENTKMEKNVMKREKEFSACISVFASSKEFNGEEENNFNQNHDEFIFSFFSIIVRAHSFCLF